MGHVWHWSSRGTGILRSTKQYIHHRPSQHLPLPVRTCSVSAPLPTQEPLLQRHTRRDPLPTLHSQQAPAEPQHPAFVLRAHLPTLFQAAMSSPPPLQQFIVQVPRLTEKIRPKRKAWEDTLILLRPWGQISNETHRRSCRRDRPTSDKVHIGFILACHWAGATGLGPLGWGRARLPPSLCGCPPCPWLGSFSLPLQRSPPCPLPPNSGSHNLSSWKPDSLFPLLSPLPPSLSQQQCSPSPEGALATRVPACSPAPAPLCAKEAPRS